MFSERIMATDFTTLAGSAAFNNIMADTYSFDESFVSTLRAVIAPRMPDEDTITMAVVPMGFRNSILNDSKLLSKEMRSEMRHNGGVLIIYALGNHTVYEKINKVVGEFSDFNRLGAVTSLYRPKFEVSCYVNYEKKNTYLFIPELDMYKFHAIQGAVLGYLPWYFNPEDGVLEDEMELLNACMGHDSAAYMCALNQISKRINLYEKYVLKALSGFELISIDKEIQRYSELIDNDRAIIERAMNTLNNANSSMRSNNIHLLSLKTFRDSGDFKNEMMDYFLNNKHLRLIDFNGDKMKFLAYGDLTYFDTDAVENIINNNHSYFYNSYHLNNFSREDIKAFASAVFIDRTVKIKTCAAYSIYVSGRFDCSSGFNIPSPMDINYAPNPHIFFYSCSGGHGAEIEKRISAGDFIGAVSQCIASAASVNVSESCTMEKFIAYFVERKNTLKCFELSDGRLVSLTELINILKEENNNG